MSPSSAIPFVTILSSLLPGDDFLFSVNVVIPLVSVGSLNGKQQKPILGTFLQKGHLLEVHLERHRVNGRLDIQEVWVPQITWY